jgi:phage gpG-like protein
MLEINSNIDEILLGLPITLDFQPKVLEDIAEIVRLDIEQNLQQGTGLDGASLAPKKRGGRMFHQTGELLKSVKKRITSKEAFVYISLNYAKYVNYGTKYMPSRIYFGYSNRASLQLDKYFLTRTFEQTFMNRFTI